MQRLQTAAEGISRVGAIVGGAMLLVASILICIDITLRYAFAITLGGADELSGYALAISSAWAKFSKRGTAFSSGGRSLREVIVRLIRPTNSNPSIDL